MALCNFVIIGLMNSRGNFDTPVFTCKILHYLICDCLIGDARGGSSYSLESQPREVRGVWRGLVSTCKEDKKGAKRDAVPYANSFPTRRYANSRFWHNFVLSTVGGRQVKRDSICNFSFSCTL